MKKVLPLVQISQIVSSYKESGKKVGLVVGSFDVCHLGHFNLFRLAKKYVDVLVVGLDSDETIRITKGTNRPVNDSKRRSRFLADLSTVDAVFVIKHTHKHGTAESLNGYKALLEKIKPDYIFTHPVCDFHWKEKKNLAENLRIKLVLDRSHRVTNTGSILDKIEADF